MRDFLIIVTTDNHTHMPIKVCDVKNATQAVLIATEYCDDEGFIIKGVEVIDLSSPNTITLYGD